MTQSIIFVVIVCCLVLIALKIHITAEMNDELASIGGFKTEHRGLIDVKVSFFRLLHTTDGFVTGFWKTVFFFLV